MALVVLSVHVDLAISSTAAAADDTSGGIVGADYRTISPLGWRKLTALTGENKEFQGSGLGLKPWWLAQ